MAKKILKDKISEGYLSSELSNNENYGVSESVSLNAKGERDHSVNFQLLQSGSLSLSVSFGLSGASLVVDFGSVGIPLVSSSSPTGLLLAAVVVGVSMIWKKSTASK